ncbi:MAG: N-acetylmuramoyl-L-alanine amidase, partial [Saprospiraceae bacterium]
MTSDRAISACGTASPQTAGELKNSPCREHGPGNNACHVPAHFPSCGQPHGSGKATQIIPVVHWAVRPGAGDIRTVVIDAGHGGKDPGCSGSNSREKHIALAVAQGLAARLKAQHSGLQVILTRDEDVFIPLYERAAIANRAHADLFVSIHCNYMPGSSATRGSETYIMGLHTANHNLAVAKRENEAIRLEENYEQNYDYDLNSPEGHILLSMYQSAYLERSVRFAEKVEHHFHATAERKSRGVKQAGFVVLKETAMPSALVEIGFLSSGEEETFLLSAEGQDRVADALAAAFADYKR